MVLFSEIETLLTDPAQHEHEARLRAIVEILYRAAADRSLSTPHLQIFLSILGDFLRPALQQQCKLLGHHCLEDLLEQFYSSNLSITTLHTLLPLPIQRTILSRINQKTQIPLGTLQRLLPIVCSVVFRLLYLGADQLSTDQLGADQLGADQPRQSGFNPVLQQFLLGDRQTADLGELLAFAETYLGIAYPL